MEVYVDVVSTWNEIVGFLMNFIKLSKISIGLFVGTGMASHDYVGDDDADALAGMVNLFNEAEAQYEAAEEERMTMDAVANMFEQAERDSPKRVYKARKPEWKERLILSLRFSNGWVEFAGNDPVRAAVFGEGQVKCVYRFKDFGTNFDSDLAAAEAAMRLPEKAVNLQICCVDDDACNPVTGSLLFRNRFHAYEENSVSMGVTINCQDENRDLIFGFSTRKGISSFVPGTACAKGEIVRHELIAMGSRRTITLDFLRRKAEEFMKAQSDLLVAGIDHEKASAFAAMRKVNDEALNLPAGDAQTIYRRCVVDEIGVEDFEGSRRTYSRYGDTRFVDLPDGETGMLLRKLPNEFASTIESMFGGGFFTVPLRLQSPSEEECRLNFGVFTDMGSAFGFKSLERLNLEEWVLAVPPKLLRLMKNLHSAGVLMPPFGEIQVHSASGMLAVVNQFFIGKGPISFEMYLNPETGRLKDDGFACAEFGDCDSPARDLEKFFDLILGWGSPEQLYAVEGWTKTLEELSVYWENLKWNEPIDYDSWISRFEGMHWRTIGEFVGSKEAWNNGEVCISLEKMGEKSLWEELSFRKATGLEDAEAAWNALDGDQVTARVRDAFREEVSSTCKRKLLGLQLRMMEKPQINDGILIRDKVKWYVSKAPWGEFCDHDELFGEGEDSIAKMASQSWEKALALLVVCPKIYMREFERFSLPQDLTYLTGAHIVSIWNSVESDLRQRLVRFLSYLISAAGKAFQIPFKDLGVRLEEELPGVNEFVRTYAETMLIFAQENEELINLIWILNDPDDLESICTQLKAYSRLDSNFKYDVDSSTVGRIWDESGATALVDLVVSGPSKDCRSHALKLLQNSPLIKIWSEGKSKSSLQLFARSLPRFDEVCSSEVLREESDSVFMPLVWACGNEVVESFCKMDSSSLMMLTTSSAMVILHHSEVADLSMQELLERSGSIEETTCAKKVVEFVVNAFDYPESYAGARKAELYRGGLSTFCVSRSEELAMLVSYAIATDTILSLCPDLPPPLTYLNSLVDRVTKVTATGTVHVDRERAFFDALPVLTCKQLNGDVPSAVYFNGEKGIDAGGLSREWYSAVGSILGDVGSKDPAGGLFKMNTQPGDAPQTTARYLVPNIEKGQSLSRERYNEFVGFGKLMALAIIQKQQLGMDLPTFFFAKFLNDDIRIQDLEPEEHDTAHNYVVMMDYDDLDEFGLSIPELGDEEVVINKQTIGNVAARVANSFMPEWTNEMMTAIREGFSILLSIDDVKKELSPIDFKLLVMGEGSLDVKALKEAIDNHGVPEKEIDLLFGWLAEQDKNTHKKFMQFITGSSSLSTRKLTITGPEIRDQAVPSAHTCFSHLALPHFADKQQLASRFAEAFANAAFAMS